MRLLTQYLDELGVAVAPPIRDAAAAKSLPVFVGQMYEVHRANLFDREYWLLLCGSGSRPTPAEVEKHFQLARSALGPNVVFVFLALPAFNRKRLIHRGIPFIVPGRQIYLPVGLIDLREKATGGQRTPDELRERLSAPAHVLLLHYLQSQDDCAQWPLTRWGDAVRYSRATLTRVCKELSTDSLCRPEVRGRSVTLTFPQPRRTLWQSALPRLESPVRARSWARVHDPGLELHEAGMTALAKLTIIGPGRDQTYAMSSAAFAAACAERRLVPTRYPEDDAIRIERWKYAPSLLSPHCRVVDRLSLYLSLQDVPDERVQAALAELLEQVPW